MKISLHCTCGASLTGSVSPEAKGKRLLESWKVFHTGAGHSPCDSKAAARSRRRQEREDERRERAEELEADR